METIKHKKLTAWKEQCIAKHGMEDSGAKTFHGKIPPRTQWHRNLNVF
jgi:hypothetical protein